MTSAAEAKIDLKAPARQFRVVTTDPRTGVQSVFANFDTPATARMEADDKADGSMVLAQVYDDTGKKIGQFGDRWKKH